MLIKINKMKSRKGFTLVELLLVVAILAVLAFLAVPAIAETIRNSRMRTCASNEKMIEDAVWRWYADGLAAGLTWAGVTNANMTVAQMEPMAETGTTTAAATPGAGWPALGPYFTPGGIPNCPFTGAAAYVIDIECSASGLDDVFVICTAAEGIGAHPRSADRRATIND